MENLPDKLKNLAQNRYFAIAAVVFFAFITAFIIALISAGQSSTQDLRDQVRQKQGLPPEAQAPGEVELDNQQSSSNETVLDRILASIGLKKKSSSTASNQGGSGSPIASDNANTIENLTKNAPALPKVEIAKYNLETSLPSIPSEVKIYQVKTNYTQAEAELMARSLGFSKVDVLAQGDNIYELYDVNGGNYLSLSKNNGEMLFMSKNGIESSGNSPRAAADAFVVKSGLTQGCVRSYSAYARTSQPDSTFVEFHCDWNSFGGPIFSSVGVLNLPESVAIAALKLAQVRPESGEDSDIVNASDGADGLERATDFNTMIIEVRESDKRILALSSNIPQFISEEIASGDKIIPPSKIIENLEAGRAQLSLASPTGDGLLNLGQVFADGEVSAHSVDVKDLIYGYDFLPGLSNQYRCPVYFVRSFGDTTTGYNAEFVQTIPAISDSRCDISSVLGATTKRASKSLLAQTKAKNPAPSLVITTAPGSTNDDTLKYGSFRFIPDSQIPPEHESSCPEQGFTNAYKTSWDKNLYIAWIDANPELKVEGRGGNYDSSRGSISDRSFNKPTIASDLSSRRKEREWWAVRIAGEGANLGGVTLSTEDRNQLLGLRGSLLGRCKVGRRDQCPLPPGFIGQIISCLYLTTASPRLHLYPKQTQLVNVSVSPLSKIGYVDPLFNSNGGWKIVADPTGSLTINNLKKDSLYWEFEKAPILSSLESNHQPKTGFIIQKDALESFVKSNIANKLGLTEEETELWIAEISRESKKITSQYLKLSFVDSDLLDSILTTNISPKPDHFHRLMLYIEPVSGPSSLPAPELQPLSRTGFTVVETGAVAK